MALIPDPSFASVGRSESPKHDALQFPVRADDVGPTMTRHGVRILGEAVHGGARRSFCLRDGCRIRFLHNGPAEDPDGRL